MAVTVKLKIAEAQELFKTTSKGVQSGTVTYSLEDFYKIYVFQQAYEEFMN